MLNEIRGLGDSLRSLALAVAFHVLRVGAHVSDTPAVPEPSRFVPLGLATPSPPRRRGQPTLPPLLR
jgi:hypothetical protein